MRTVAFVVAILLGIVAVIGVLSYVRRQQRELREQYREVQVAVARRSINEGEVLTRDMVGYKTKLADSLTGLDIVPLELDRYLGRRVNRNIDRGAPILVNYFTAREPQLASRLMPEGMRAVSINVDGVSGVSGLINPGDSVDILATIAEGQGGRMSASSIKTRLILSDVTVLAVDDRISRSPSVYYGEQRPYRRTYSTLTLAVTPLEAQILVYLREQAKLTFVLRPSDEVGQKRTLPQVDSTNVVQLAEEANRKRQERIQELEILPAEVP